MPGLSGRPHRRGLYQVQQNLNQSFNMRQRALIALAQARMEFGAQYG